MYHKLTMYLRPSAIDHPANQRHLYAIEKYLRCGSGREALQSTETSTNWVLENGRFDGLSVDQMGNDELRDMPSNNRVLDLYI
jgi:hypothetical protein